jgi:hypothetical protein
MRLEPADIDGLKPLLREMAAEVVSEMLSRGVAANADGEAINRLAFSEAEAASMLGIAPHVLREQRRLGKIEFCRGPGRRVMYTRQQINEYLTRKV